MSTLELPGLDPLDPLGFLASLGVLVAVTEDANARGGEAPHLGFELGPSIRPRLASRFETLDQLVEFLASDVAEFAGHTESSTREPFLSFSYRDDKDAPVHDLKPPREVFAATAREHILCASHRNRRTVDMFSAVLTDVAVDGSGMGKPFALHFTAGQQRFLTIALELVDGAGKHPGVSESDLHNALLGPWANDRPLKVFSWSPSQDRSYALRATDPSTDTKLGTPGADWLAFRGLRLISSAPMRDKTQSKIQSGGVEGGWKSGTFTYPLWPMMCDTHSVAALLRHPALVGTADAAFKTWPRSVERWRCRITRSEQGGYGAFSRPRRLPPMG